MSKAGKLEARIRNNPCNVHPGDLNKVLESHGFEWRQNGTSHRINFRGAIQFSVPQKKQLLAVYVKLALKLIDEVVP